MDSKKKEKDVVVFEKDMDMAGATRGVWLVKVPKYISSRWEKCPGNITAGQLNITKSVFFMKLSLCANYDNILLQGDRTETSSQTNSVRSNHVPARKG